MKVIVLCGTISCAEQRLPYERLSFICKHFETTIITRGEICEGIAELAEEVRNQPESLLMEPLFFLYWTKREIRSLELNQISFIYTPRDSLSIFAGYLNKKFFDTPWVVDLWEDLEIDVYRSRGKNFKFGLPWLTRKVVFEKAKRSLNKSDLVMLNFSPKLLTEKYGVSPGDVLSIPHALDQSKYPEEYTEDKSDPGFVILYAGAVSYEIRDFATIVEAVKELKSNYGISDFTLKIVGYFSSDRDEERMLEKIEALGISSQFDFAGEKSHEETLKEIRSADVCINPLAPNLGSNEYAFTIKMSEYMAFGKPVLATNLPGIKELVNEGETGLLVPPGGHGAWAGELFKLYNDDKLRKSLGKNAREKSKDFRHSAVYEKILNELESLN